jgi:hypothetical protein
MPETKATGISHPPTARQVFWQGHVARWQKSGLSIYEYCRQKKISDTSFRYWRKRLGYPPLSPNGHSLSEALEVRDVTSPGTLVQIAPEQLPRFAPRAMPLTVRVNGDRFQVEIVGDFEASVLLKVIRTLEAAGVRGV